jgi:hypothetical protein
MIKIILYKENEADSVMGCVRHRFPSYLAFYTFPNEEHMIESLAGMMSTRDLNDTTPDMYQVHNDGEQEDGSWHKAVDWSIQRQIFKRAEDLRRERIEAEKKARHEYDRARLASLESELKECRRKEYEKLKQEFEG